MTSDWYDMDDEEDDGYYHPTRAFLWRYELQEMTGD